ncbi:MAG: peptide-methionine (S)-S-oxide reductase MsrA [Cytophagaceae bacterium]|nr:peptide-methionine (S)-S-oxide reductase MsrA [Gemmatimonadaceae bacterium]
MRAATPAAETAIFSAGCYWTVEAVFEHVRGVTLVEAGLSGREVPGRAYLRNPTGTTGPAEAVRVTWDPSKVTYEDLLRVFFTAAHDPTSTDRQGPDVGARYRSVLWVANDRQQQAAVAGIARLEGAKTFARPIVTQVATAGAFNLVPEDQQDFVEKNPGHPYVVTWDRPRLARFKSSLPTLFRERR